jgi:hypothetical protein
VTRRPSEAVEFLAVFFDDAGSFFSVCSRTLTELSPAENYGDMSGFPSNRVPNLRNAGGPSLNQAEIRNLLGLRLCEDKFGLKILGSGVISP